MKFCNKCQTLKELTEFRKAAKYKDGLQTQCTPCMDAASEAWRLRNIDKRKVQQKELKAFQQKRFAEWKSNQKCMLCPESDACCLDFHHIDSNTKDGNVSDLAAGGRSWEKVMAEINKCVIVCRNCHAKIHGGMISLL